MKATALFALLTLTATAIAPVTTFAAKLKDKTEAVASTEVETVSADSIWQIVAARSVDGYASDFKVKPGFSTTYVVNAGALAQVLSSAPLEFTARAKQSATELTLPMPDGSFERFRIEESPIMESELAAQYPEIKTYVGQGIDDPTATARLDRSPSGFHAQILSAGRAVYIDPYRADDTSRYISYDKRGLKNESRMKCLVETVSQDLQDDVEDAHKGVGTLTNAGTLRTYRLAMAATGEYTAARGGTVASALASITTTVNRVTGIYERELSIRLVLVNNTNLLIYTNGAADPYNPTPDGEMLDQNQANTDSRIGSANYDIGHVVTTGDGGLAGLGVACVNGQKASGATGRPNPTGDAFDVDYVAHEIGHQFGGNHTFNASTSGSCIGGTDGNRNGPTAYEPGSGSTIQAYAGICSPENVQANSDPNFHAVSLREMLAHVTANPCGTTTATGNTAPTVNAGTIYTIPQSTPFTLTAVGSDANGDALTYSWEQWDLGTTSTTKPLMRSRAPSTSPSRTFPAMASVLAGTNSTTWETTSAVNRTMRFVVTARDNRAGGGGIAISGAAGATGAITPITITVSGAAFSVTAPNTAVSWAANSSQTVTWNKGGTTSTNVNIKISTDGGTNWSTLLANTPNDGTQAVTVPNTPSTTCRIMVEGAGNIYFDVSNVNFTITGGGGCVTTPIAVGASANGTLATTDCTTTAGNNTAGARYDDYTFSATAGTAYTITLNGSPFDAYVRLLSGTTVLAQDDDGNGGTNSKLTHTAAASGTLTIRCTTYAPATTGTYTLTLTGPTGPPTLTLGVGTTGSLGAPDATTTSGNNAAGAFYDDYRLNVTAGQQYTITLNGSPFDAYLRLFNGTTLLTSNDDGNGGTNSKIVYTATATGQLTVRCTSYAAGTTGTYTVLATNP